MTARVGIVLVAHAAELARGTASVAKQMAPDVPIEAVGGFWVDGLESLGTDVDAVRAAVSRLLDDGRDVVVLGDLGSAVLTAELVLELLDDAESGRVRVPGGPFVEGAVAAAVRAAGGAGLEDVAAAARGAALIWNGNVSGAAAESGSRVVSDGGEDSEGGAVSEGGASPEDGAVSDGGESGALSSRVVLGNTTGLHARPAAILARLVAGFDASVTVNGAPAESVFELMKLAADGGAELEVVAVGPGASEARDAVVAAIASGLGER